MVLPAALLLISLASNGEAVGVPPAAGCERCSLMEEPSLPPLVATDLPERLAAIDAELAGLRTEMSLGYFAGTIGFGLLGVASASATIAVAAGTGAAIAGLTSTIASAGIFRILVAFVVLPVVLVVAAVGIALAVLAGYASLSCFGLMIARFVSKPPEVERVERRRTILMREREQLLKERQRPPSPVPLASALPLLTMPI